jgi:hypothetical protein
MASTKRIGRHFLELCLTSATLAAPLAASDHPQNVYWGDLHVHTKLSNDAYLFSGNRLGPSEAYRFARGEEVVGSDGIRVRIRRPLDFMAVTDHAENMGVIASLDTADAALLRTRIGASLSQRLGSAREKMRDESHIPWEISDDLFGQILVDDPPYRRSIWSQVIASAERYNEPGKFTALIGFEWTEMSKGTMHRNVIFRDGAAEAGRVLPFSTFDGRKPEQLWAYLADYQSRTGGEALAIPHNPNLSQGTLFALVDSEGLRFTKKYAESRSRWEPLLEITQHKGTSETHPVLSPTDEFASFEIMESTSGSRDAEAPFPREHAYARSALKLGLGQQAKLGANPFKFGFVGGSDTHFSLSSPEEGYFLEDLPLRKLPRKPLAEIPPDWDKVVLAGVSSASGFTAVWARENTRASLFEALKRNETYASTGPRITVRFFGGWHYEPRDAARTDFASVGYRKGVPMGGDLTRGPKGKSPRFLIRAVKDSDGANLDRLQVIKGWRNVAGELQEQIFNVALSDGRKESRPGQVPAVGSTVNFEEATYTNTIGASELAVVWEDPQFRPEEQSFYYVRVIEIPTPRWTAHDARRFDLRDVSPEIPLAIQERAFTSAIWYTP